MKEGEREEERREWSEGEGDRKGKGWSEYGRLEMEEEGKGREVK